MTLEQKILELTAEDGPNVPLRTLAIYCGTSHTTLSRFAHGKLAISEKMREQIEKGMEEMAQQIWQIANS